MLVGLIINPIAGMGGRVGLKGTDGYEILQEAKKRGAEMIAVDRTEEAIRGLNLDALTFLTASGDMGESLLERIGAEYRVVHVGSRVTGAEDTRTTARRIIEEGARFLVFTGGDGTAIDVMEAIDRRIPVIAIPSGVKMHSAVFANDPIAAGELLRHSIENDIHTRPGEVMDIDERAFREGRLSASLHGYLDVIYEPGLVQSAKSVYQSEGEESEKDEIAQYMVENIKENVSYVMGPGTTVAAIARKLGLEKTLLGVDIMKDGDISVRDASERDLLDALGDSGEARIVVTPIGSQGFIFGRGNQQISPPVIRRVGLDNVLIVATPTKLRATKVLRVDTGDPSLNRELRGYVKVLHSYGRYRMIKVE